MEKKVLIVDDEERVVQSIAGVLEDEGFRVVKAKSGEEAIDVFQEEKPDVTLLDIWMVCHLFNLVIHRLLLLRYLLVFLALLPVYHRARSLARERTRVIE